MKKENARLRRIAPRIKQINRPSSALFLITAVATLWLASIVLGTVHGAKSLAESGLPSANVTSPAPQQTVINTTSVWQDINPGELRNKIAPGVPDNARTLRLNADALAEVFKAAPMEFTPGAAFSQAVLVLPMPDGKFEQFRLVESPIMQPELLKKFPEIKSYSGQGIDNPRMTMRCDYSPRGFNTLVLMDGKAVSVHPARWDDVTTYVSYYGQDFKADGLRQFCGVTEADQPKPQKGASQPTPLVTGSTLRQYRLAIAVTQEYYNDMSLGGQSVANTIASLNTWLNAVNAVYEREFAERMILVNNETNIIFTAEPDGLTNGDKNTEIEEIKTIIENQIGLSNYDVGHLLSRVPGGGGLAAGAVVCRNDNSKGRGVTEVGGPSGNFDGVHVFSHELGHQHGAAHSWNGCIGSESQRSGATGWEVGSGFTIMSYGGVCTTDNIVPYRSTTELRFHVGTYEQINSYMFTTTCAVTTSTGNNPPTVDAGTNYTIPKQTPFILTASASDPDGGDISNLTYCWEELDAGGANYGNPPYDDSGDTSATTRPIFRAYSPTTSPSRVFPALTYILNYANDPPDTISSPAVRPGEELPRIGRTLNFRVTARDNHSGGGGVNNDSMVITVNGSSGPFLVTAPNTAVTWTGGTSQTVTWSVNNTNAAPISCANVKITLSTDGGNTFPIVLAASTANDGAESVSVPNGVQTSSARIKIESIGNIFFDIDDANFTINTGDTCPIATGFSPLASNAGTSVTITGINFTGVSAVKFASNVTASFTVDSDTQITATVPSGAVTGPITLTKSSCTDAQTASFIVCTSAATTLSVDDGSIDGRFGGPVYWVNRLTPASYPATLTHVSIYWDNASNAAPAGTSLNIIAGTNIDGDATINNSITQSVPATVQSVGGFNTYALTTPITISAGDFVVGFGMTPVANQFPAPTDTTAPNNQRSYTSNDAVSFGLHSGQDYLIRGVYFTGCSFPNTISPTSQAFLASGGSGSVSVTATGAWTAVSNDSWIHITTGSSGSGNGTVTYSVDVNNTGSSRTGTMTIAGQTFTVTQDICAFSITPSSRSHDGGVNGGTVDITASPGCTWSASSNAAWLSVTSACSTAASTLKVDDGGFEFISGGTVFVNRVTPTSYPATLTHVSIQFNGDTGNQGGTPNVLPTGSPITVLVGTNTDGDTTINNSIVQTLSTTVQSANYTFNTYAITPVTISSGDFVFGFKVASGLAVWPVSNDTTSPQSRSYSSSDALTFSLSSGSNWGIRGSYYSGCAASSGTGDGTVIYSVAANNTGSSRSGTLTVGGQTFTVNQSACAFSISPTSQSFSGAGTGSVSVTTLTGCTWPATSNDSWITITSGASGTGNGTVNYSVAANNTGSSRSGTITIGGQTFTVTQSGCAYSISPASRSHTAGTAGGTVDVTTGAGCNWTATSNDSWITVSSTCSGTASTLSVDDGGLNNAGSGTVFVNRLTPASYPATLTKVSIYFHNLVGSSGGLPYALPAGTSVNILVGTNTDGDSTINNSIVQTTAGTVQTTGAFNTYDIAPVTISAGDFVIGFSVASGIAAFPCPRDLNSPASRSYSSGDAVNFTNDTGANYMLRGSYYSGCPSTGGSGSGAAIYSLSANSSASSRSGTITIAGQTFTVTQSGCTGTISPTSRNHAAAGGNGAISVTAPVCPWTAISNAAWLTVSSACSNPPSSLAIDTGSITNIRGSGSYYVNRLTPATYPATLTQVSIYWYGGSGGPPINTPLTILAGTNTDGDSTIDNTVFQTTSATVQSQFAFSTYDITPITIGSGDFVIGFFMSGTPSYSGALAMEQTDPDHGVSYLSSNGTGFSIDSAFDYMIRGSYFSGCSASTASGNGTVIYSVAANNSGASRSGTLTIAGQTFTVTQDTCASMTTYYADADGDGFGNPSVSQTVCFQPAGYVTNNLDCNDSSANVNPNMAEICGDGIDDNCDGLVDIVNNNGLDFDGTNDFVQLPHVARPSTMTIEAWVKSNVTSDNTSRTILSWTGNYSNIHTVEFNYYNGNVSYGEWTGSWLGTNGWFVGDGNWHHVAVVRNGNGSNNLSIYIDGILKETVTVNFTVTTSDLSLGCFDWNGANNNDRFFKGSMDEVRIWNVARTATQIRANMLSALSGSESGLIRLYNFNRGTAGANNSISTSLPDSTSNAAHGTLGNFALSGSTSNYVSGAPISDPRFSTYYADSDGDGYGNPSSTVQACSQPAGYVANNLDCDDTKANVNITKPEICGNSIDDNCDGVVDSSLNNALNFDGSNDFVVVPHIDRPSTMTIEAWIKTNSTSGLKNILTWTGNSPNLHTAEFRIGNGNVEYAEYTTAASLGSGAWSVSDNNWHHVALVRNGDSSNNVTIYVDGVLRITSTVNLTTVTSALRIGCFDWNANNLYYNHDRFFLGSMDEVRIWNVARTQAQIQANMNAPLAGNESGLLRYYNFNRGTAGGTNTGVTSLYDLTSNMANGTLGNFALSGSTSNWVAGAPMAVDNSCASPGSLQFAGAPYTDNETNSDHTFTVNVSRTGGSNGAVSVNYAVTDGTATAGSDYTVSPASGTLTWAHGDTANKSFTITIKGDTTAEASETINLSLSGATGGATLGSPNSTTVTITDDDSRDLSVTAVTISQLTSPYSAITPVIGESVWVKVDYQTNNLPAGSSYRIQASMDGVPISLSNLTSGAGAAGAGGWSWILGGWYATTGSHTINVTLDADNTVAETNESNNTGSASFTTGSPTSLPSKFVSAIGGVPFGDWQIQNYVDVDTVPVTWADFNGGTFAYDAHNGHDIVLPNFARMDSGIPIYAAADGTVTQAADGNSDRNTTATGQPANYVYVSHGNGWETQYYHLLRRSVAVKVGQTVTAGQLIGLVGSSGNSTDAHLHIGVYRNGALVEPMYSPSAYYVSPFSYQGTRPSTILDMGVINYSPSTYQERPAATVTYSTLTPQNPTVWFRWSHLAPGTSYQVKWYRPNGTLAATFNNTPPSSMERGGVHAWAIGSGNLPGNLGTWRVAVEIGGTELKSTTFVATGGAGDPGIIVLDGSAFISNHRTTQIDFGSAAQGAAAVSKTFTVQNHGTATLNLSNLMLPAGFALNGSFPSTVAAGGSATFTVNMTTSVVGSKFGAIRFTTDDPTASAFDFHISGTITGTPPASAPVITLSGAALAYATACQTSVIDSLATVTDSDSPNFNGGNLTVSFSTVSAIGDQLGIRNAGAGGGQIGVSGSNVTYGGTVIGTLAGGTTGTPLTISFNSNATPAAAQELVRNITFKTGDPNAATLARYVLFSMSDGGNLSNQAVGSVITDKFSLSDINVLGNGASIVDGDSTPSATDNTDFGSIAEGGGLVSRTFTIQNTGTAALNLTGTPKVSIAGANAADFVVTAQPVSPVAASGGIATFTIQFDPSDAGLRTATVNIATDDCDESTFDFAIQGIGTRPTWTGATSADWNTASNWSLNAVPSSSDNVMLPDSGVTNEVLISTANVSVNNLTLGANRTVSVSGNKTLTVNGVLTLGGGNITVAEGSTLIIGASGSILRTSGYVIGALRKVYGVTGSFTFTVGTANGYSPVDVNVTTGTGNFTVKAVQGPQPDIRSLFNTLQRYWTLTASGMTANLTFNYLQLDVPAGSNESSYVIIKHESDFSFPGGTVDSTANTASINGVSSFSDWTLGPPDAPTAVDMISLTATRFDKHVLLEWQTGYEVSNIGFNIYREKNHTLERINPEPVAGSALIAGPRVELKAGLAYSWWDDDDDVADCGSRNADCQNLRYWIEDIDLSGRTTTHGPFGVRDAAAGDPLADRHREEALLRKHNSSLLSTLSRGTAQSAEAATVPVEPLAKVAKLTPARMSVQSGIASQNAVKLLVQNAAWYRVEQADLVAAGLPAGADPAMLQLLADGREVPMLVTIATSSGGTGVGPGGVKTNSWDGIEFYGVGIDSPSTANHVYWVVAGSQPGLRIGNSQAKGGPPAPSSFAYTVERRDRSLYFPALKNGGAEKWFGPFIYNAQPVDQSVTLQHAAANNGATLLVSLQGFTNSAHTVRVLFNNVEVGTINFSAQQKSSNKFVIPASNVREGVNQIQLIGPAGTSDMSLADFVQVTYAHSGFADSNSLRMPVSGQQSVTIDGFTSSAIRVMDVTDANSPVELQTAVNGSGASKTSTTYSVTATAPGSGARLLLAFASDQQKRPSQIVANQPSNYRDPNQRADYLVITRKDLAGSFSQLADWRSKQGLTPKVIDVEDIYDEFNFGNKNPQAIKDFLAYAKSSWAMAPRFVVLGGDATYDPKNYLGTGDFDVVPTRLVETAANEAATDDWFVDVNGDSVPDIAIGRLPVRTPAEAAALAAKIVGYDSSSASNNVLLVADRNSSFDFEAADTQLRTLIPASMTVTDIRRGQVGDANARSQLLAAFNQGAKIVNFYGHGSTTVWTDAPILSASDAAGLTNQANLPLVVSMTCLNAYFVTSSIESLGESLLKSQGGAIAVWASSGLTDAGAQTVMSRDAITRLFSGSNLTIGEVVALSKTSITNMDVRRTWILLGDPATKLR